MVKILSVVGARPQFIKAAPVSRALRQAGIDEVLIHTGQHYDANMSDIFFDELGIPQPWANLNVGSGSHAEQTAHMLLKLEPLMVQHAPDAVLVYGDTNSTLAGALVAAKLGFKLAHVEAGLRSFNRTMPEEHNRVLTDHSADLLFCPTQNAVNLLAREGITRGVYMVGDTMFDAVLQFGDLARQRSTILQDLGLEAKNYLLATVHRPYNTDVPDNLSAIVCALADSGQTVVFPVHPRTRQRLPALNAPNLRLIEPLGYLDMLLLEQQARCILTDSGGVQKEAYFFGVPCLTLRPETEWIETLEGGWNVLVGADYARILTQLQAEAPQGVPPAVFGDGHAAQRIASILLEVLA
ncbi:MAG: UDP-N-acetylglucosamine 2-epimerase (non-hydrolyzing) [Anaerolineae bacterium]|nr:UDP-N-acetylglucosamine 2-epimerase (non-hydrolyzing) [Anaerolineae bacterium]MDW8171952.1 UDP-N-acetylglucosamine 2-epimerase (non-hydrolyzing) [Anaerolineae bacterium]